MDALTLLFVGYLLLPPVKPSFQLKPMPITIQPAHWTIRATPLEPSKADYLNESHSLLAYWPTTELGADDIHRNTPDPIIAVDLGYYTEQLSVGATVYIYANPDDSQVPPPPVASFAFPNLPGGDGPSVQFVHVALPQPVNVPADIWVGVKWDDPTGRTGLLAYSPPSLGISHNLVRIDGNGDLILEDLATGSGLPRNFFIGTYVPCPDPPCGGDLNLDGRIDGRDIQLFTDCAVGVAPTYFPCFRADLDENGLTDDADAALLVGRLLTAP